MPALFFSNVRGGIMTYSYGTIDDIYELLSMHKKFHVDTIPEKDKPDGFVTTPFTEELLTELIRDEKGIFVAREGDVIGGYCMAASWQFCSKWPMFQYMISRLHEVPYRDETLTMENSYQYGPICIDKPYRGKGVFQGLFQFALKEMSKKYPFMVTFVNKSNPRSVKAHADKLKLDLLKEFQYNNNHYLELICPTDLDTSAAVR